MFVLLAILVAFVAGGLTRVRDTSRDSTTRTTLADFARISAADAFTSKRLVPSMFALHVVDYRNAEKQTLSVQQNASAASTTTVSLVLATDAQSAGLALRSTSGRCVLVRVDLPTALSSEISDATGPDCSGDAALGLDPGR